MPAKLKVWDAAEPILMSLLESETPNHVYSDVEMSKVLKGQGIELDAKRITQWRYSKGIAGKTQRTRPFQQKKAILFTKPKPEPEPKVDLSKYGSNKWSKYQTKTWLTVKKYVVKYLTLIDYQNIDANLLDLVCRKIINYHNEKLKTTGSKGISVRFKNGLQAGDFKVILEEVVNDAIKETEGLQ